MGNDPVKVPRAGLGAGFGSGPGIDSGTDLRGLFLGPAVELV